MKKVMLIIIVLLVFVVTAVFSEEANNPFLGTWAMVFQDKPMAFLIEFQKDMTYNIYGRFIYSPQTDKIAYVKLKEDKESQPYNYDEDTIKFWDQKFDYLAEMPGTIYLFIGGKPVVQLIEK